MRLGINTHMALWDTYASPDIIQEPSADLFYETNGHKEEAKEVLVFAAGAPLEKTSLKKFM